MKISDDTVIGAKIEPKPDDPGFEHVIVPRRPEKLDELRPEDMRDMGVRCPRCACRHCPTNRTKHTQRTTIRYRTCRHCGKDFVTRETIPE